MVRLVLYLGVGALVYYAVRALTKQGTAKWRIPTVGGVVLSESSHPGASPQSALGFSSHRDAHAKSKSHACRNCENPVAVQDHFDESIGGKNYYVVTVACRECSARSRVYFQR